MTPRPDDIQPALDQLEAALEASCASLLALRATGDGARDLGPVEAQIGEAIKALREAIAEMRALHDTETSMLAFGFVLGDDPEFERERPRIRASGARQLSPRRTA